MGAEIADQRSPIGKLDDLGDKAVRSCDAIADVPICARNRGFHTKQAFTTRTLRFVIADSRGTLAS
jgi:hypothetical protein